MMKSSTPYKPHRRAWIQHHGHIPFDSDGTSYEIHHINGDNTDNRIENLQCVSIREHYEIHHRQGDAYACASILRRMNENELVRAGKYERLSLKGENHPLFGVGHSEATKKKISENHHDVKGKKNPMFGRKHTKESREKMSKKLKGTNKGVPKSPETREKMRLAALKRWERYREQNQSC